MQAAQNILNDMWGVLDGELECEDGREEDVAKKDICDVEGMKVEVETNIAFGDGLLWHAWWTNESSEVPQFHFPIDPTPALMTLLASPSSSFST